MKDKPIGEVTHYFDKIQVAAIKLLAPLKVGDTIHIKGHTTDFQQAVASMQLDHESVQDAKRGDEVGLKINEKARSGDEIYLVKE